MALYQDGILISGANTLPKMTLAEYNALPADQRPTYWERLDADYDDVLAPKTDIATVESGTTASRPYSVGELVYVSGTLYRVKTAIASGATFTVGTNIEVVNVSNAIKNATPYMGNMAPISANTIDDFFQNFKTNILKKCYVGQGFMVSLDWAGFRTFLMQGIVQSSTTIIFISTTPYDNTQNWCVNAGTTIVKAQL